MLLRLVCSECGAGVAVVGVVLLHECLALPWREGAVGRGWDGEVVRKWFLASGVWCA